MALVEDCLAQLGHACEPRHLTAVFPLSLSADGGIDGGCFRTHSRNLSRNLADCHKIIVFAATLGTGADHLIHKYSRLEMSRAVVMQAAAAAMIEEYCDQVCSGLKAEYEARGEYLRPRFSPGYGDFPLECQPALLGALEAGKRIGIKLTDSRGLRQDGLRLPEVGCIWPGGPGRHFRRPSLISAMGQSFPSSINREWNTTSWAVPQYKEEEKNDTF